MRNRRNPETLSVAPVLPGGVITMELLSAGAHARPSRGPNLLELVSVLSGERWSTRPESVHPALAVAAEAVNDLLDDAHRRLLTPLAPWLPGTGPAGAGAWAAIAGLCDRAAESAASRPDPSVPQRAGWNAARDVPGPAGSPPGERRHRYWARRRDRRKITDAIRSAQVSWARAGSERAAAALCQLLTDCVNVCRRLAGEPPVDPRLPLASCPAHLQVQPHFIRSPGCDWMELGYQPVAGLLPACLRRTAPDPRPTDHHTAA